MKLRTMNSGDASRWMQTDRIHCGIMGNDAVKMISIRRRKNQRMTQVKMFIHF